MCFVETEGWAAANSTGSHASTFADQKQDNSEESPQKSNDAPGGGAKTDESFHLSTLGKDKAVNKK
jgi:hypothetical protein